MIGSFVLLVHWFIGSLAVDVFYFSSVGPNKQFDEVLPRVYLSNAQDGTKPGCGVWTNVPQLPQPYRRVRYEIWDTLFSGTPVFFLLDMEKRVCTGPSLLHVSSLSIVMDENACQYNSTPALCSLYQAEQVTGGMWNCIYKGSWHEFLVSVLFLIRVDVSIIG